MELALKNIIPIPLQDKLANRPSDIWDRDLCFLPGEWVKIQAPSGTGKTTFVHIIYKLRTDYRGMVLWDNQNVREIKGDSLAAMRQQHLSIVFQDLRLFPNLTARENIELKRVLQKPIYDAGVIDEMADRLGITMVLDQRTALCSYGEQQRIAIIRALMQPFHWLVMDEPFSHLDYDNIMRAADLVAGECKKRGAGFLLTDLENDEHFPYTRHLKL